ncbi:MAG: 50S ribosomal protein L23 [Negativicutes bacterium]
MEARDILLRPLVTEKSTALLEEGKYVFEVAKAANKVQIAQAVAEIFNVKVVAVNTINVTGKVKRVGRNVGRRRSYKKAIVTLAPGETIQFFEG